jgi:hypothetical protein
MLAETRAPLTPWVFAESMYMLEGKPFRLTAGRNYLKPIYNADMTNVLLMTGRQVEKSTTVSTKISNNILLRNFSRSLYVAPLNEQVKTFSRARLDKLFRYSQRNMVHKRYMSSELTYQVFHKEFLNGSEVYLRNCYEEADNIRGLSIDDIFIDEVQDIHVDALPIIMETQTRSKNPHFFLTGTPKSLSNTIQQQWERSSRAEWVVRCPACGTHQILGVPNVTPKAFICRAPRCHRPLPDIIRAMGRWEHGNPGATLKGFRITQMMVPDISPAKIYEKIINYPKVRLYNEVLGRSYEQADKPFTERLLYQITDNTIGIVPRAVGEFALRPTFMGIDWGEGEKSGKQGTGYTVITIFSYNASDKFQMLYAKRFERGDELDPDFQINLILQLMETYRVNLCVADYGAGQKENMRLRKILGDRFYQCHYVGRQKLKMVYEEQDFKWKLPRSYWLTKYIEFVQAENVVFPGKDTEEMITWLHANFLSIYSEYRHTISGISEELFYGHSASEPDDAVHSGFYAWLASQLYKPTRTAPGGRRGSIFRGTHGA